MSKASETIVAIVENKSIKNKQKTVLLSSLLLDRKISTAELIQFAKSQVDVVKATAIESMEMVSKNNPEIIDEKAFEFAIESLTNEAPRVKWEAARLIANTAQQFPKLLKKAVINLLANAEHAGTVVRWSAATALVKIISLKTPLSTQLIASAKAIVEWETDNAIKKVYGKAIKE